MRAKTAEIMFVKDNDLLHINMERDESIDKAFASLQVSVGSWGKLLIATGDALKPAKCFGTMIALQ